MSTPAPSPIVSLHSCRVLVIEDNEFERKVLASMLGRLGVGHVVAAANGSEGLKLIDSDPLRFDVILCDLRMHDPVCLDGIEFLRVVALRPIGRIVVLSGLDEDLLMATEILAGGSCASWSGILRKPIDIDTLRGKLLACHAAAASPVAPRCAELSRPRGGWNESDLRLALARREFVPFFQPQVSFATGRIAGVEALARWQHPQAGLLDPSHFVPLMEGSKKMVGELFDSILDASLDAIVLWASQGLHIPVSINASPLTLEDIGVPNRWRDIVERRGIDPGVLTIEVTETAIARDYRNLLESITRLRMHGFKVSLDDFGTSYSSLQQLSELPANEVKIDRSFVARAMVSPRALVILKSIVSMARELHLMTVAEGIETADHYDFARQVGCDVAQGWHVGLPMPAEPLLSKARALEA